MKTLSKVDQFIAAKVAAKHQAGTLDGTVKSFLFVLRSKLTQQDMKDEKKNPNPYRLGLLFQAATKVEDMVKPYLDRDDEEAMDKLEAALKRNFNPGFPPLNNLLRQIKAWKENKKTPSITAR
jgi:hypothetical protein